MDGSARDKRTITEQCEVIAWISVTAESALYVDRGRDVILCDRLPHPVELVLKLTPAQFAGLKAEVASSSLNEGDKQ